MSGVPSRTRSGRGIGGFLEHLGQGGVGVAAAGDVLAAGAEGHGAGGLGDELADSWAYHVDAEDSVCVGVGQDLDEPGAVAECVGASVCHKRENKANRVAIDPP